MKYNPFKIPERKPGTNSRVGDETNTPPPLAGKDTVASKVTDMKMGRRPKSRTMYHKPGG